jgi:hypothetical protein
MPPISASCRAQGVVVLGQRRGEDVAGPVQAIRELAEHEVAVDGIRIVLKKAPKLADRCEGRWQSRSRWPVE